MTADDEHAIRTVIFDYAWSIDTKDWAALAACFTEDCDLSYGHGDPSLPHPHDTGGDVAFSSRDGFVAYIARTHEPIISVHLMGATAVSPVSDETAGARTYGRIVLAPRSGGRFESTGIYEDALRKEDGIWRISARRYTRLWAEGNPDVLRPAKA